MKERQLGKAIVLVILIGWSSFLQSCSPEQRKKQPVQTSTTGLAQIINLRNITPKSVLWNQRKKNQNEDVPYLEAMLFFDEENMAMIQAEILYNGPEENVAPATDYRFSWMGKEELSLLNQSYYKAYHAEIFTSNSAARFIIPNDTTLVLLLP